MSKTSRVKAVLCALLLLVPVLGHGVDLALGLRVGVGHTGFYGPDYERYKDRDGLTYSRSVLKVGFSGGVFATLGFFPYLALQPEVLFTISGDSHGNDDSVRTANLMLLEIPVLVKGRMPLGSGTACIFAGPDFGIELGTGRLIVDEVGGGSKVEDDFDAGDVNSFQVGVLFGGGYDVPLGPGSFSLDLRYKFGITRIHSDSYISDNDVRQSGAMITVGYSLTLLD